MRRMDDAGTSRLNRDYPRWMSFPCSWTARTIYGWERMVAAWTALKEKSSIPRLNFTHGRHNRCPRTRPAVCGWLLGHLACLIGQLIPCKIFTRDSIKMPGKRWWIISNGFGLERGMMGCFFSKPIILFLLRARKF